MPRNPIVERIAVIIHDDLCGCDTAPRAHGDAYTGLAGRIVRELAAAKFDELAEAGESATLAGGRPNARLTNTTWPAVLS